MSPFYLLITIFSHIFIFSISFICVFKQTLFLISFWNISLICANKVNLTAWQQHWGMEEGGGTTSVRSFLIRALLTALPDDIIRASGWLSRQIAAQASLTNTAPSLVSV